MAKEKARDDSRGGEGREWGRESGSCLELGGWGRSRGEGLVERVSSSLSVGASKTSSLTLSLTS